MLKLPYHSLFAGIIVFYLPYCAFADDSCASNPTDPKCLTQAVDQQRQQLQQNFNSNLLPSPETLPTTPIAPETAPQNNPTPAPQTTPSFDLTPKAGIQPPVVPIAPNSQPTQPGSTTPSATPTPQPRINIYAPTTTAPATSTDTASINVPQIASPIKPMQPIIQGPIKPAQPVIQPTLEKPASVQPNVVYR